MFEKTYRIEHDRILDHGFEVRVHFRGLPGWWEVPDYNILFPANHFDTVPEAREFIDNCIAGKNVRTRRSRVVEYYPSHQDAPVSEINSYPAAWDALTTSLESVPSDAIQFEIVKHLRNQKPKRDVYDFLQDIGYNISKNPAYFSNISKERGKDVLNS